ncbi:efflux RND transporter permease subunit [Helicobacter sp. 13S00477-4]|uniref:efflux RND transporter permease subunit n=1 Tax=Helicobacter sp. 13S00477-4 TaxID=1905759 RepID=UPI000BA5BF2D|nr:efflux RND transporter permease subunit [Helicobacter sp. 13S00477-4]PAF51648.1 acriflavin resistance protein [Helicobacter sp. 13S00477-4]
MYKFAITRPITTLMFALAIIFFGIMGLKKIPTALFPDIDFPIIMVSTTYPGASADVIESKVTDKIEEAVMGIDGIKKVTSNSARNISLVIIEFQLEKPIDEAMNDVINKVSSVKFDDPNIQQPSMDKFDTNGQAIISLFLSSDKIPIPNMMKHSENIVKPMLQKIYGVGGVQLNGYRERQIRIYADPTLMNKYGITYSDLWNTLAAENLEVDGGRIVNDKNDFSILTDANSYKIDEVANIRVAHNVKLSDIAVIEDGIQEDLTYAAFGEKPGVIFEVQKISGANEVEIADGVYAELPAIKAASPGYEIKTFLDTTEYIRSSIKDIEFDLMLGGILAVSVVFLFLRNITITLVSAISIPVSVMGTFALVQLMGYSLNMLTMVALTLSIGIIIDDAIVVIENIHKKLEAGMSKREAAYEGVREIGFAIVAISAMLLSVFIPIGNMTGIIGRFFQSFGVTVALAIAISYVVVITIIPMISSLIVNPKQSKFYYWSEPFFKGMENIYIKILKVVLNNKIIVIVLVFAIFAGSIVLAGKLGSDFMLKEDRSQFYVWIQTKPGISIYDMQRRTVDFQKEIEKRPDVDYTTIQVGYGKIQSVFKSKIYVKLKPEKERKKGQFEIMKEVGETLRAMPEAKIMTSIIPSEVPLIGGGDNSPFQVYVFAPTQKMVDESVKKLKTFLLDSPELKGKFINYHTSTSDMQPQFQLTVLRQVANKYGVTAQDIGKVVNAAFSGDNQAAYFKENGKEYYITVRVPDNKRISVDDIKRLQIKNKDGKLMFLDGLVDIKQDITPSNITRYDRQRSVTVYGDVTKGSGISLGDLLKMVTVHSSEWLTPGASIAFGGDADNLAETAQAFGVAVATAFILIYLILAALYESLLEPLIIMVTMPLSFSGAFFALGIVGQPLSMFSMMGLILLIGMVGKNATLLIDVANDRRKEGHDIFEAIILAGESRLRPILMTTIAMVFGMLPLAIATGDGSAMKSPIGIAMTGGLLVSMFLSLLIVPVFYKILAPLDDRIKKLYKPKEGDKF